MVDGKPVREAQFNELVMTVDELLESLTLVVKRLEALPGAEPMDSMRSTMTHVSMRLHDLTRSYLGDLPYEGLSDFTHPEHQGSD